ncbi:MAG: 3-oxoadipate enol-lactonase [Granulosicoccus sp.]|nr:3-oxoadipate enol-lactonase [Granulosicoccus sp.]
MAWHVNNGIGIHWREDGPSDAQPIVFLNSLGTDLRLWDGVVSALDTSYRCVRIDTRGHGLSDAPSGPYKLEELTSDIETLVQQLDLEEITLVGVSLGGMMAQRLAANMPNRIARAVYSNTAARMGTPKLWADRIESVQRCDLDGIADTILDRWFGADFRHSKDISYWRNMLLRTPTHGYMGCCHALAQADLTNSVVTLRAPALVIAGSEDGASPPDVVESLASALPIARFDVLDKLGHLPMAEQPATFSRLVLEFIEDTAHA